MNLKIVFVFDKKMPFIKDVIMSYFTSFHSRAIYVPSNLVDNGIADQFKAFDEDEKVRFRGLLYHLNTHYV